MIPQKTEGGFIMRERMVTYAAQFAVGRGRVTYTSFHNQAQTTADMDTILEHLILSL